VTNLNLLSDSPVDMSDNKHLKLLVMDPELCLFVFSAAAAVNPRRHRL
jgi:hypothetical protein